MQRRNVARTPRDETTAFVSAPAPQLRRRTYAENNTSHQPPPIQTQQAPYSAQQNFQPQGSYFSLNDPPSSSSAQDGLVVKGEWVKTARKVGLQLNDGLKDAARLDRSLRLIMDDAELRSNVIKSTAVNLVSLLSVIVFDVFLLPSLKVNTFSPTAATRARRVRLAFDLLWKYPIFAFCFWVNTYWSATISKRALNMHAAASRLSAGSSSQADSKDLMDKIIASLPRFLIIFSHNLITFLLRSIPFLGAPVALVVTCLVNAYYCFEPSFKTRGFSLFAIGQYIFKGRIAYFVGFGVLPTALCAFVPFLASVTIFALIYPVMVVQALQARSRNIDFESVEDALESPSLHSPGISGGASSPAKFRRQDARSVYKRFLQAFFSVAMLSAKIGGVAGQDQGVGVGGRYDESLTLKPLPGGQMGLLFDFRIEGPSASEHFRLLPPSLLLPLQRNNVSEMHLSIATGRWRAEDWGQPQHPEIAGTGAELRAWFRDENPDDNWQALTNALAGLFCSSLGQIDKSITSSPQDIFPEEGTEGIASRHAQLPAENLCTENLTPTLKLLPCRGMSGLSALMKPYILLAHGWHALAIDYVEDGGMVRLGLRWEAVVDLVKGKVENSQDLTFSTSSIFDRPLPNACPVADSSKITLSKTSDTRVVIVDDGGALHPDGSLSWNLDRTMIGKDIKLKVLGHAAFPPTEPISISRVLTGSTHSNAGFAITIRNNGGENQQIIYTEELPWWIGFWLSEMEVESPGVKRDHILIATSLQPAIPRVRPSLLQLQLVIPAQSQVNIRLPFTKEFIRYTEHLPDASRGWEIPPAMLYLLDGPDGEHASQKRRRLYTSKLLTDLPTPDFSMPYNVIIMTSTLIALFFGSVVNLEARRWGVIHIAEESGKAKTE